jgi:hypothetical protein
MNGHADGQQDRGILNSMQGMPGSRYDEKVTGTTFPARVPGGQPDPAAQHLDGSLTEILVLSQGCARCHGEHRLPQRVLMAAIDGFSAASCQGSGGPLGLLADDGIQ